MTCNLMTVSDCAAMSGLRSHEIVLGVSPSARHDRLFARYRLNLAKGYGAVREKIVADIRASLELGASNHAADLLIVLRRFLAACDKAGDRPPSREFAAKQTVSADSRPSRESAPRVRSHVPGAGRTSGRRRAPVRVTAVAEESNVLFLDAFRRSRQLLSLQG